MMLDKIVLCRFVGTLVVLGAFSGPAVAANADHRDCSLEGDVNVRIAACTRMLADKREPVKNRSIAASYRCMAFTELGDRARATADCVEAARLDPRGTKTWNNVGASRSKFGDLDGAAAAYDAALRLDPRNGSALQGLALIWREKGNIDRAIAYFSESLQVEPGNPRTYINRALARAEKGDFDRALADASEAIGLYPNWAHVHAERGYIWRLKGDLERGLQDQTRAVEIGSVQRNAEFLFSARGDTYRYLGQFDRALADYDHALNLKPGYVPALTGRGLTFERMGDSASARAEFQKALSSTTLLTSDFARSGPETARAHLAALQSGTAPPSIPVVPSKAATTNSIPTPKLIVPTNSSASGRTQERRVALVIGNSAYRNVPVLGNPERDAGAVAASLRAIGFDNVTVEIDNTRDKMLEALRNFVREADKADWAMIYYAGHGIEMGGVNYLIPVDARFAADRDVQREAIAFDQVMATLEGVRKLKLVLLDACRDNPFAPQMQRTEKETVIAAPAAAKVGTRSIGRGLAEVRVSGATLVVFAAKQGQVALDGDGDNGPFAVAFVNRMATPGVEINKVFRLVRDDVMEATGGRQEPYTYGSLPGNEDLFFVTK